MAVLHSYILLLKSESLNLLHLNKFMQANLYIEDTFNQTVRRDDSTPPFGKTPLHLPV